MDETTEMSEEDTSQLNTSEEPEDHIDRRPRRKKGIIRKKKFKSKSNLNLSGVGGAISLANNSVMKATLHTNNRALAKALEQKKSELFSAQQIIMTMQAERQELLEKINLLQECQNGLDIDAEIEKRVQQKLLKIKEYLGKVAGTLLQGGEMVHEAMGICSNTYRRIMRSESPKRLSDPPQQPVTVTTKDVPKKRNIYCSGPSVTKDTEVTETVEKDAGQEAGDAVPELSEPPAVSTASNIPPDLSIIMEQSYFDDLPYTNEGTRSGETHKITSRSKSRSKSGRRSSMTLSSIPDLSSPDAARRRRVTQSPRPNRTGTEPQERPKSLPNETLLPKRRTRSMTRSLCIIPPTVTSGAQSAEEPPCQDSSPIEQTEELLDSSTTVTDSPDTQESKEPESDDVMPVDDVAREEQEEISDPDECIPDSQPDNQTFMAEDDMTIAYDVSAYLKMMPTTESPISAPTLEKIEDNEPEVPIPPPEPSPPRPTEDPAPGVSSPTEKSNPAVPTPTEDPTPATTAEDTTPDTSLDKSGEDKPFFSSFIKLDDDKFKKPQSFKRPQPLKRKLPISIASKDESREKKKGKKDKPKTDPSKNKTQPPKAKNKTSQAVTAVTEKKSEGTISNDRRGTFVLPKSNVQKSPKPSETKPNRRGTFVIPTADANVEVIDTQRPEGNADRRGTFCVFKDDVENIEDISFDFVADSSDECDDVPESAGVKEPEVPASSDVHPLEVAEDVNSEDAPEDADVPQFDLKETKELENQTTTEVADMSMTEVISPSASSRLMSILSQEKVPVPAFVKATMLSSQPARDAGSDNSEPEEVKPEESEEDAQEHEEPAEKEEEALEENVTGRRSSRQCKAKALKAIENNCAKLNNTTINDSIFITPPTPEVKKPETIKKKFSAFLDKPGKVKFTRGRKDAMDFLKQKPPKSRSKSRSTLPTLSKPRSKQARSKTRLLSRESLTLDDPKVPPGVFDFPTKKNKVEKDPMRSAFDVSLSDSVCTAAKPTLSQYRERQQQMKEGELPEAPVPTSTSPKEPVKRARAKSLDTSCDLQGIMLVAADGRRTKPRQRSKSVRYATKLTDVRITTPPSPRRIRIVPSSLSSGESTDPEECRDYAGNTPPRLLPPNIDDGIVPESPLVFPDFEAAIEKQAENPASKRAMILSSLTSEEDVDSLFQDPPKKPRSPKQHKTTGKVGRPRSKKNQPKATPPSKMKMLKMQLKEMKSRKKEAKGDEESKRRKESSPEEQTDPETESVPGSSTENTVPDIRIQPDTPVKPGTKPAEVEQAEPGTEPAEVEQAEPVTEPAEVEQAEPVTEPAEVEQAEPVTEPAEVEQAEPAGSVEETCPVETSEVTDAPVQEEESRPSNKGKKKRESANKKIPRVSDAPEAGGRKPRRAAAAAASSLKEPSLGGKLRQGDKGTTSIYSNNVEDVPGQAKTNKRSSRGSRKRSALSTISNV